MWGRLGRLAALAVSACSLAACNNSPAAPSFFAGDTFTGTVARLGFSSHSFTSQENGPLVITITSLAPTTTMGLGLGAPAGEVCQASGQVAVNQGDVLQPTGDVPAGTYCIVLFDIGNLAESSTVAYSVHVFHK